MNDTRIVEIKHISGEWHQYDIKLNFAYGWAYVLKSAQHLITKDLLEVDEVIAVNAKGDAKNFIDSFKNSNNDIEKCPEFRAEFKAFSISGTSGDLKLPIKVIWFTQTQVMRMFTIMEVTDADLRNFLSEFILIV